MWQATFFDMFSFRLLPGTTNRTWSDGSTHRHDSKGKFVSAELKSERLKHPNMTTVLAELRLDERQRGKVNIEGGKTKQQFYIWEMFEWQVLHLESEKLSH